MDSASHRLTLYPVDDVLVSTICELLGIQLSNKRGYGRSLIPALSKKMQLRTRIIPQECDWSLHNQCSQNFSGLHSFLSLTVKDHSLYIYSIDYLTGQN